MRTGAVTVRAGGGPVEFGMYLVYIGTLKIMDKSTRTAVADSSVIVSFTQIPGPLVPIVPIALGLSNGTTFGAPLSDSPGVFHYMFYAREAGRTLATSIPIPATVSLDGYKQVSLILQARLAGSGGQPQDVEVETEQPSGLCTFILSSSNGTPVGPTSLFVSCNTETRGERVLRLKFDERGESGPVPLPVGPVVVRAPDAEAFAGGVEEQRAEIRRDGIATVRLRIHWGGLLVRVVDQAGNPLDDYGLRVGPGHGPVRTERKFLHDGSSVGTGLTYPPTGIGNYPVVVRFPRMVREGPITIEAFRHGYALQRRFEDLVAGEITRVRIALEAAPEAEWLPRIEYPDSVPSR